MAERGQIRLGVIGVGDFGARHAAIAAALAEVDLVAVADRNGTRAAAIGERYGARPFPDAAALLDETGVDAVVIATPEHRHLADLELALAARVPALVEKPIVATAGQAAQVRALVRPAGCLVMPAHVSRFLPAFAELRDRLRGHTVRAVRAVRVVPAARLDLHGTEHPALVAMVHDLDLVHALVPEALDTVASVQRRTDPGRAHPQVVLAHLQFTDGVVASVENYWTLPHERQYIDARLEVTTDRALMRMQTPAGALHIATAEGDFLPDTELEAWVAGLPVGALATQMRHFVDCVVSGRVSTVVTVDDALWSVEVAARIAEQAPR
jgi:UDP-N-acetylglucosamine 3-dehydrogenase